MSNPAIAGNTHVAVGLLLQILATPPFSGPLLPFYALMSAADSEHRDLSAEELAQLVVVAGKLGVKPPEPEALPVEDPNPPIGVPVNTEPPKIPLEEALQNAAWYYLKTGDSDALLEVTTRKLEEAADPVKVAPEPSPIVAEDPVAAEPVKAEVFPSELPVKEAP